MITEAQRLATLQSYAVTDTASEPEFDDIVTRIAASFRVRSAVVSFIDEDRQWYKARHGVAADGMPRALTFCTHILDRDDVTVVAAARVHPTFRGNAAVRGEGGVRFYAAAPIKALNRARLGTVCIFDPVARPEGMTEREKRQLSSFAAQVVELLERRRNALRAQERAATPPAPTAEPR